jgi:ribonuclease-3
MTPSKGRCKVFADIFEAYVAAVILSLPETGFATAERWLTALWEPQLVTAASQPQIAKIGKQRLLNKLGGPNIKIDYRSSPRPLDSNETGNQGSPPHIVDAVFTGYGYHHLHLGTGVARSVTEAANAAALDALGNESLMKQIQAERKKVFRSRSRKESDSDSAMVRKSEESKRDQACGAERESGTVKHNAGVDDMVTGRGEGMVS